MINVFFSLFFCLSLTSLFSQTVQVIDRSAGKPLEFVLVYSTSASVYTDEAGRADIEKLLPADSISFQHSFYKDKTMSFAELEAASFRIRLHEKVVGMGEILVSANRWEQDKREVAMKITAITPKDIAFQAPQTTADMLAGSGEVFVQKSQLGGGSPMIRGFSANRILIVVDGVRMNNAIYRSGNLQNVISLDANSLENAEVVFGPGSTIYGSDAIGGVMSFQTLNPSLNQIEGWQINAEAFGRFSSANREQTYHWQLNAGSPVLGISTSATYSNFDDQRMGSRGNDSYQRPEYVAEVDGRDSVITNSDPNRQAPSGYQQFNMMQKLRYRPNPGWDMSYGFHFSTTSDVPRYDRLIEYRDSQPRSAEWYYGPQKWMMHVLNLRKNDASGWADAWKMTAAYQDYEESRNDRRFQRETLRTRTENVKVFSVNLDVDKRLGPLNTLYYGAEAVLNEIGSDGEQANIFNGEKEAVASRYPDGASYGAYAGYLNFKSNFHPKHTLLLGARYSLIRLNADFDNTFFDFPFDNIELNTGAANGSLGWVFRPMLNWQINLNAGTGFRAPNVDDVGKVFDSEPGSVVVPNENLKPEYAYSVDLGTTVAFAKNYRLEVTGFYTLLKDAMVRRNFTFNGQDSIFYDGILSDVQAIVNADEAEVYGFQAALKGDLSRNLSFRTHFTWMTGEDKAGLPLRHVSPTFGSFHLNYYPSEKWRGEVYAHYNGEIAADKLAPSEAGKPHLYAIDENGLPFSPSWFTLNAKFSYELSDLFQLNGGVENILDERYRPYASGIAAAGRNFIIGIRRVF